MQIKLYQDIYQRYIRLSLSRISDRPIAIRGLELRLLKALGTRGGQGVLEGDLARSLLWRKRSNDLECIDFTKSPLDIGTEEPKFPPSWSWMAYEGPIKYMNRPHKDADWQQWIWEKDLVSSWDTTPMGSNSLFELRVQVRNISPALPTGPMVYLDKSPCLFPADRYKCVVLGQRNNSDFYVLIVRPRKEGNVYVRAGVARLKRKQIGWDSVVEGRLV